MIFFEWFIPRIFLSESYKEVRRVPLRVPLFRFLGSQGLGSHFSGKIKLHVRYFVIIPLGIVLFFLYKIKIIPRYEMSLPCSYRAKCLFTFVKFFWSRFFLIHPVKVNYHKVDVLDTTSNVIIWLRSCHLRAATLFPLIYACVWRKSVDVLVDVCMILSLNLVVGGRCVGSVVCDFVNVCRSWAFLREI